MRVVLTRDNWHEHVGKPLIFSGRLQQLTEIHIPPREAKAITEGEAIVGIMFATDGDGWLFPTYVKEGKFSVETEPDRTLAEALRGGVSTRAKLLAAQELFCDANSDGEGLEVNAAAFDYALAVFDAVPDDDGQTAGWVPSDPKVPILSERYEYLTAYEVSNELNSLLSYYEGVLRGAIEEALTLAGVKVKLGK